METQMRTRNLRLWTLDVGLWTQADFMGYRLAEPCILSYPWRRMTSRQSTAPDLAAEALQTAPAPLAGFTDGTRLTTLHGWGRFPVAQAHERRAEDLERITAGAVLTRGLGRSYGDSSLPPASAPVVAASPLADRLLAFGTDT